jgi:hypothetical protein
VRKKNGQSLCPIVMGIRNDEVRCWGCCCTSWNGCNGCNGQRTESDAIGSDRMIRVRGLQDRISIKLESGGRRLAGFGEAAQIRGAASSDPIPQCGKWQQDMAPPVLPWPEAGDRSMEMKDHPLVASQWPWRRRFAAPNNRLSCRCVRMRYRLLECRV